MEALVLLLTLAPGPDGLAGGVPPCGEGVRAASELFPTYPPCFEVTLEAEVSGRPPLEVTWTLPDGGTLTGNPVALDTGLLPTGFSEILLEVSNDAGTVSSSVALAVEPLRFSPGPSFTVLDGTTVAAEAQTTGATQWRWSWGDGTGTGWLSGCEGYAPTHTYPAPGTYAVRVEARSCREGPLAATATLDLGGGTAPLVERFEVVCPTAPFCSFEAGVPVPFDVVVSGTVDAYLYDWDGDGSDEEVVASPVFEHVFSTAGFFIPRLTVVSGSDFDVRHLEAPVEIVAGSGVLFSDGFESGDLRHWRVP